MITQENFDIVSIHIAACICTSGDYGTHYFTADDFGDCATKDEVFAAFEEAGYNPKTDLFTNTIEVVL